MTYNTINLDNHKLYNNRELSWLKFNERVLRESMDSNNPLLEQIKFLSIFSSNLDEFFMIRVAGLKNTVKAGHNKADNKSGLTPSKQLKAIDKELRGLLELQYEQYLEALLKLRKEGVSIEPYEALEKSGREEMKELYTELIEPTLTPIVIDKYKAFPVLINKLLYIGVRLVDKEDHEHLGLVPIPSLLSRVYEVGEEKGIYCLIEDIIANNLEDLFRGYSVKDYNVFRVTKDSDFEIEDEDDIEDMSVAILDKIKSRIRGAAVRLEISQNSKNDDSVKQDIMDRIGVEEKDTYESPKVLDLRFIMDFACMLEEELGHLAYEKVSPQNPKDLKNLDKNIFNILLKKDILLIHPFEKFDPVVKMLEQAAEDPNVLAIKQVLYRVSKDSPIIKALRRAAENGKQVTVLVELKARFDEENNLHWASELERAGCHVIYGVPHLKTHSKISLVVRKHGKTIKRFVHYGTGNYNDKTAKLYTDLGYMTSKKSFGIDATNFFNYLTRFGEKPDFKKIVTSPYSIREEFVRLIDDEIKCHKEYKNGRIIAKMNSLTDKVLIKKLYEASMVGIKIDLIIRGICCLKPGVEGVSENITVTSVVGRFLEHSRIYYFSHNKEERIYISSADLMTRNMVNRVEIACPIIEKDMKVRLKKYLDLQLRDNMKAHILQKDGEYIKKLPGEEKAINSQDECYKKAYQINSKVSVKDIYLNSINGR